MLIELNEATKRNTKCWWVRVGDVLVLFSYWTPIAFNDGKTRLRVHNRWGPTTGRHMSDANVRDWPEAVSEDQFERMLDDAITNTLRNRVTRKLLAA